MSPSVVPPSMKFDFIFHPSDFSEASEVAFAHALRIAMTSKAQLDMFHVATHHDADWKDFPRVRDTLERWALIPHGSHRSAVAELGIDVHKAIVPGSDPLKSCLEYLDTRPTDLIVLAMHQQEGRIGWLNKSVGEPMAQRAGQMTLFIRQGQQGFVSTSDGTVRLRNILIPIREVPDPRASIEAAERMIHNLQLPPGSVTLLHVGPSSDMPVVQIPEETTWRWQFLSESGNPVERITRLAEDLDIDLIVMATDGPHGFLDGLRSTTSHRILHKAHCPVIVVPVPGRED